MSLTTAAQTFFTVDGTKARLISVPDGGSVTVYNTGNTLYYDNSSAVTSSSNDGNIATGASAAFTSPQYVITAQGLSTEVFIDQPASLNIRGPAQSSDSLQGTTSPKSGTSALGGTGAGRAAVGALYVNTSSGVVYVNEGTVASPYWTPMSYDQPDLFAFWADFRNQTAEGVITGTAAENILAGSGLRLFGQGLTEVDSGLTVQTMGEGGAVGHLITTDEDAHLTALGTEADVFQPDQHGTMVVDADITNVSAITTRANFFGFTNVAADALDPLQTYATTTITHGQDDLVGLVFSSELTDNDKWFTTAEKANAGGTQPTTVGDTGVDVAAAGTYQRLRVEVDTDGAARGFINKTGFTIIGPSGAGAYAAGTVATDPAEEFAAAVYVESTSAAVKTLAVKRFACWGNRV